MNEDDIAAGYKLQAEGDQLAARSRDMRERHHRRGRNLVVFMVAVIGIQVFGLGLSPDPG